jgi:acyl dehydratase
MELRVGEEIPRFERAATFQHWNRYAAVNDEFVDIHMDDDAGRAVGYPGAIGMGNLQWSYLHCLLRAWLGDRGRIESVRCQFRGPSLRGDRVVARGRITAVRTDDPDTAVELEVWIENGEGEVLAPGSATVLVQNPS